MSSLIERIRDRFRTPDPRDEELNRMTVNSRLTLERITKLEHPELTDREIRIKVLDTIVKARTMRHR